jgi:hypothetical protein
MSLLGAIATIAGGLLGRPKKVSAGENRYSDIQGLMAAAKDFGWNPLTLLTNGQAIGPTVIDNSAFGNAVANAGMMLGEQMSGRRAEKAKMEKLNQTQARLQKRLETITLRAPVPGVYGGVKLPSDPEVYGGTDGAGDASGVSAYRGAYSAGPAGGPALRTVSPADPRREVDNRPQSTTSGVMVIDSPYAGEIYVPSLDGDEALDVLDLPSMAMAAPQVAYNRGYFLSFGGGSESRPSMTRAEALAAKERRDVARKRPKAKPPVISVKGPTRFSGAWVQ